jgi:hypothetical protein
MAGVRQPRPEQARIDDLPLYLTESPSAGGFDRRRLMDAWSDIHRTATRDSHRPCGHYVMPFEGRRSCASSLPEYGDYPVFEVMVPLERRRVAAVLEAWWPGEPAAGVIILQHRLKLWPPEGDILRGWEMRGRLRRLTALHWVPVLVYLWGKYDGFMRISVTPQSRVLTSRRYFRLGNSIVEQLFQELAHTPVRTEGAAR